MKKPFEPIRVNITGLHPDGYATTHDEKFCVLGALPGEVVTALPFTRKKRKLFSKTIDVHKESVDRVTPDCEYSEICGGCSLQHQKSEAQIEQKQLHLTNCLDKNQPQEYFKPLTGPVVSYRSKARLGVKFVEKKERVLVGFREKMKPFIADISSCCVLREPVSSLIPDLADLVSEISEPRSVPQIEVAVGDTETALVFRHLGKLTDEDIKYFREFARKNGVSVYLQPSDQQSVYKLYPEDEREYLTYSIPYYDLVFSFHPLDFTQINQPINRQLVRFAIDLLGLDSDDVVLDGFCGIGNFSLAMARSAGSVIGLEGSTSSVRRARENAAKNGIDNCEFEVADLFDKSLELPGLQRVSKVLLDPPRSGAEEVCKRLATHKVERLVYVSCNPQTLARDVDILVKNGFQFDGAGVIDMFPHTTHVESIACFSQ